MASCAHNIESGIHAAVSCLYHADASIPGGTNKRRAPCDSKALSIIKKPKPSSGYSLLIAPVTSTVIPLTIKKAKSTMHNMTLLELCDVAVIRRLIKSKALQLQFDPSKYGYSQSVQYHKNQRNQLSSYLTLNYNRHIDGFLVRYIKPSHGWGRVTPHKALGCTSFSKKIRNTLIHSKYYDIDIAMAQYKILYDICRHHNIPSENLRYFVLNRDSIYTETMERYGVNKKATKKLYLRFIFLGGFTGWIKELNLPMATTPTVFLRNLAAELNRTASIISNANNALFKSVVKIKEKKNKTHSIRGSFLSYYLQEYETRVMECVIGYLSTETRIMTSPLTKIPVGIYEYDGVKLLKVTVDEYGGVEKLTTDLKALVCGALGFELDFVEKPIEAGYPLLLS